jgi:hypothetical protein
MWLLGRLAPDHKTVAEFRRSNPQALVAVCAAFVQFARRQRLIAGTTVAIDGTKVRAAASRKSVLRKGALDEEARRNAQQIEQYLKVLDTQDSQEAGGARAADVRRALKQLESRRGEIQADLHQLAQHGAGTVVKGEPDAQVMGHALNFAPGYNLQSAVESHSHLIVAHEVTNDGIDRGQFASMADQARTAMGKIKLDAIADPGCFSGPQIKACEDAGITACVPKPMTSSSKAAGRFSKADFICIRRDDEY